jgi:hypothetical protein
MCIIGVELELGGGKLIMKEFVEELGQLKLLVDEARTVFLSLEGRRNICLK